MEAEIGVDQSPSMAAVSRDCFVQGMRLTPTAVSVVTTDGPGGREGATISAVASVSADPPSLLICVYRESRTATAIGKNGVFCVNLLCERQHAVADEFAGRTASPPAERFKGRNWIRLATGAPALAEALAVFDCRSVTRVEQGSHSIFVGEVVGMSTNMGEPLVYADRGYCKALRLAV